MSGLPLVGARVCFTGLTPDAQDALVGKLRQLGAHFADNLIKEVTHLVVGKVGSEKHRKAMAMPDVHLVEVKWALDCIAEDTRQPEGSYRVRPFVGLTITVTQLPQHERFELEKLIESGGGSFEQDLDPERCTHLVAGKPEGAKYASVRYSSRVRVMRGEWVRACAQQNVWLSEKAFLLPCDAADRKPVPRVAPLAPAAALPPTDDIPASSWGLLRREVVFVAGFDAPMTAYLVRALCAGGGLRLPMLTERVNKALLGPLTDPALRELIRGRSQVVCVTAGWLVDVLFQRPHAPATRCAGIPEYVEGAALRRIPRPASAPTSGAAVADLRRVRAEPEPAPCAAPAERVDLSSVFSSSAPPRRVVSLKRLRFNIDDAPALPLRPTEENDLDPRRRKLLEESQIVGYSEENGRKIGGI